jgi:hypothetical protein
MQKELAKKQKAMRRTSTMTQRSQAIRLNRRGWSKSVELRIIETRFSPSCHLQNSWVRPPCTPLERKEDHTSSSRYGLTLEKMDKQRENREQQQNMNQSAGNMKDQEAPQPSQ